MASVRNPITKIGYLEPRTKLRGTSELLEPSCPGQQERWAALNKTVGSADSQLVFETTQNWRDFHWGRVPSDLWVILETSEDAKRPTLTAFDPLKGKHKLLRTIKKDPRSDNVAEGVSPDGLTFAIAISFETEIHIRLLSLAHGSDRKIAVKGWPDITGLDWSADGKGFYCGSTSPQGGALLYVDLPGTAHVLWRSGEVGRCTFLGGIPSPDGRYLPIWARLMTATSRWLKVLSCAVDLEANTLHLHCAAGLEVDVHQQTRKARTHLIGR